MRYIQLDALRGIAAITVFFSHAVGLCSELPAWWQAVSESPLHIFFDGAAAVNLFFILSGFCIALPYVRNKSPRDMHIVAFLLQRVFRLYPAYFFAILLAWSAKYVYVYPGAEYISSWGGHFYQWGELGIKELSMIFSLIGFFDPNILNPPSWSLVVEMRMALILPIVIIFLKEQSIRNNIILYIVLLLLSVKVSLGGIMTYLPLFFGGIIIAKHIGFIYCYINKLSRGEYSFVFVVGLILYTATFPWRKMFFGATNEIFVQWAFQTIIGFGSAGILICFFRKSMALKFSGEAGAFLGRISYSLYLVHFPILMMVFSYGKDQSSEFKVLLSAIISIIVAYMVYRLIELPMIDIGRCFIAKNIIKARRNDEVEFQK